MSKPTNEEQTINVNLHITFDLGKLVALLAALAKDIRDSRS